MHSLIKLFVATAVISLVQPGMAQSLKGSRASMEKQHQEAVRHGYTFVETARVVSGLIDSGDLVKVSPTRHLVLHDVSYPYARPVVTTFVERLSAQYFASCGEKMTVTSLTRPIDRQPKNASSSSVHPTGMAVDLRIPSKQNCRSWLEKALLSLEATGVLDVTRERNPPHYHVAVYPTSYQNYVASSQSQSQSTTAAEYVVRRGDTLSKIATRTGTTIAQLRAVNGIRGDLINVGQKLQVISSASAPSAPAATATAVAARHVAAASANQVAAVTEVNHRVQRGETLWRIANRYGITVDGLQRQNGLADELLQVGQVLRVSMNTSSR